MLHAASSNLTAFAATYDRLAERTIAPGRPARMLARLAARPLDAKLIAGADPADSSLLAARACRLTSRSYREELASWIVRILSGVEGPTGRVEVVPNPAAMRSYAAQLTEMASLLQSPAPLYARGIAMLARLLTDGTGPVYVGRSQALGRRLGHARTALTAG
jgi:hypothetical protein